MTQGSKNLQENQFLKKVTAPDQDFKASLMRQEKKVLGVLQLPIKSTGFI